MVDEKETKPTPKRTMRATGKSQFEQSNSAIVSLFDIASRPLVAGINKGNVNVPLSLISFMAYADLLHGGAYAAPINERPFYMEDRTKSPYFAGELQNADANQGFLGWLLSVLSITNAGPMVQEIHLDANVPHVLPKLLSDEAYAATLLLVAHSANTDIFKSVGTGLQTFVDAAMTPANDMANNTAKLLDSGGNFIKNAGGLDKLAQILPLLGL